eukprot:TRINITY_DN62077_c0_g1_i1.p1 TRINITY_DN62077_c0_g1~~TRINITY_DN62077_c0_g1_i1.p1  ORF type:complete len:244 (+),score=40.44 TRINITY_DN62077_c0_g1_i1:96-827(+)
MSWANTIVARLATGDLCADEFCGLVLACSWPMPAEVVERYQSLREELVRTMPPEAYLYPGSTLHCTICTFRAFTVGNMSAEMREVECARWQPVLRQARTSERWPCGPFRLRMTRPTLEGSAAIFHYEDLDGAVKNMRECLKDAIEAAGGCAAIGGGDRSLGRPLLGAGPGEPPPHIPDILHSTILRWAAEPSCERSEVAAAFDRVAEQWEPLDVVVTCARAVFEDVPYMHMPSEEGHVWWSSL